MYKERHVTNYSKSSIEIIYDLINAGNSTSYSSDNSELEPPRLIDGARTSIEFRSLNPGHVGSVTLHYSRVHLSELLNLPAGSDPITIWITNNTYVVDAINFRFGINLQRADISIDGLEIDQDFEQLVGTTRTVVITAKPDSYVWIGSVTFNLTIGTVPFSDRPKETYVEITDRREIRTTSDGEIRVFAL